MKRVLVTNDDGIDAPGLNALASGLVGSGYDVAIVAPMLEMSGSSSAMGRIAYDDHFMYEMRTLPGLDGVPAYAIDGPPALCVIAGVLDAFEFVPDVVVAGINLGFNCGRSTLHSGTVGAVLTAANWGVSGLAVSTAAAETVHWSTATDFALAALGSLRDQPVPTVVNLNVPNLPAGDVRGIRETTLAPYGAVRTVLVGRSPGRIEVARRHTTDQLPAGSDTAAVQAGYASISFLRGIGTA